MSRTKYKLVLVEQPGTELSVYSPPVERKKATVEFQEQIFATLLLQSLQNLKRRSSSGGAAWTTSLQGDPLGFILDSMSDAWTLKDSRGNIIFASERAEQWGISDRQSSSLFDEYESGKARYQKRGLRFAGLTIELIRKP